MTTISTLPTAPSRADPATFSDRSDALLGALDTFVSETNTVAGEVNANAATATTQAALATTNGATQVSLAEAQVALATTQATNAAISAAAAASSALVAGATIWVSGTSYTIGGARYSPLNGQVYRRLTNGAGTTDPSADTTNWIVVNGITSEAISLPVNNLPTIRPTLLLDFANSKIVDSRIAFTRASTATYVNAFGRLSSSAINAPRIDYDPVTLACKGLLIEESRTNLLTYSEQFDNAAWTKFRSSVTANAAAAPDGTTTADKLVEDNTASNTHYLQQSSAASNGATYTVSAYFKAAERTQCQLVLYGASEVYRAVFDLAAGTLLAQSGTGSYTVTDAGNGWYRIAITAICNSTTCYGLFYTAASSTATYSGDGTSGIYIWGAQLEAGSFATSYIPTTSAPVTRAADVASMTSTNFSSWYRADEGSFVVTSDEANSVSGFPRKFTVHDGTANNTIQTLTFGSSDALIFSMTTSGVTQASQTAVSEYTGQTASVAVAYKANDSASSANGATATVDSSCTPPSGINALRIGAALDGTEAINGHIARIAYYPKRLTNSTLQALSTL